MDAFDLFRLVLDEYSSRIIQLTSPHPMNAIQLSDALGIPIAACYRRIRTLKEAGVLKEEGRAVSIGGKLVATYRSSLEKAEVILTDGRLRILIKANGQKTANEVLLSDEPSMLHWPIDQDAADK
ncbi:MAG: helix-turn-helix domain-containing protein [Thermoplasmata archaeon]|jgi:DNA-binding Lrp family transcriptional regulator|nr:helix-turn-helix domain-containing protein [Thermoplasmata archaeon]